MNAPPALLPVLRHRGGLWIGWTGTSGEDAELTASLDAVGKGAGYTLKSVALTEEDFAKLPLPQTNRSN